MCLVVLNKKRQVAKKDIIVWKHIIKSDHGTYVSSYQHTSVELNELYTSELIYEDNEVYIGLHSFKHKKDAICERDFWNNYNCDVNEVLVKCMIPKGANYYTGIFGAMESIASDELIYLEIIE